MSTQNLLCNCNLSWGSILPPPPCRYHSRMSVAYNGLCTCRGYRDPHPFHQGSPWASVNLINPVVKPEYVGKHRMPS